MAKLKLGEILMAENKIDSAQLKSALAYQRRWGKRLGDCFIDLGFLTEIELMKSLANHLRLPLIDLTRVDSSKINKEILTTINVQVCRRKRIVPIAIREVKNKRRLVVATSDPTNYEVFDEVQFKAGLPVLVMISPDTDIDWFIRKYYLNEESIPENYVSAISLIAPAGEDFSNSDHLETDPITNIFMDDQFTSASKVSYSPSRKGSGEDSDDG